MYIIQCIHDFFQKNIGVLKIKNITSFYLITSKFESKIYTINGKKKRQSINSIYISLYMCVRFS